MNVDSLNLINYRNYKNESIFLSPSTNVFVGKNASGKTNILESIYYLALAKSYRAKDKDVLMKDSEYFKISANMHFYNGNDNFIIVGTKQGKKILVNNIENKKISEFVGKFNVVMFSPDDIFLLKNGPVEKRRIIDLSLLQLSKQYVEAYILFKKELKLRNEYLKYLSTKQEEEIENEKMLEVLTSNFIKINEKVYSMRLNFIKELEKRIEEKYKKLSGEDAVVKTEYIINFENNIEFYNKKTRQDIVLGSTQNGCHRDDIKFYKNSLDFETNCSQGENRMLVLSIKLALADMLKNKKKDSPVVLLDDVLSELDKNHQNRLLELIDKSMQTIITTTDISSINDDTLKSSKIFAINNASVKEIQING